MKKIITNKVFIFVNIILLILFFIYLNINKESYALEEKFNYLGDYILNPDWVEYMNLSDYEKSKYNVIPDKFIVSSKNEEKTIFKFLVKANDDYPEYYNLNDLGYSTSPRNQSTLGICWAFAGIASVESNMLINGLSNIENPITFSERQMDYVGVHKNYIQEGYNPYAIIGRTMPGMGGYTNTAFVLMETGLTPVSTEIFGYFDEDKSVRPMNEIFNLDNVEYTVDGYVNLGSLIDSSTKEERDDWVESVKEHVMNYGAVAITTLGPLRPYAGLCIYEKNNNYMLNVNGNCNPSNINNRHAMAIIGWDDNYEYNYCRLNDETTNDLTNCKNIVSGKGAFILKNSWGTLYPYPYFSYTSNVDGAYGVTKVSEKNWDVNYDFTKSNTTTYEHRNSIITYDRSNLVEEQLVKISFYTNTKKSVKYDIYFKNNEENYELLDSVITDKIGLNTIEVDNINLTSNNFSIKITSDDGYVDLINAYTTYSEETEDEIADTIIKTGTEYQVNFNEFALYTVTKNIEVGSIIQYKFTDKSGNDISNKIAIQNNVVLNNMVNPIITINNSLPEGRITIETLYNNEVYDIETIQVGELESLWNSGSGSIADPYLIENADDFIKIFTSEEYMMLNYKLINDIDFSLVDDWNVGELSNYKPFKGTFDGNGHIISSLSCNSNLCPLFYNLENAKIKNIVITDFDFDVEEYGWGNIIGVNAYNSEFENIVITRSVEINGKGTFMGGILAGAYNSKISKVANYANVNSEYSYENGRTSGIVNEAYATEIDKCYNYGNIISLNSISAGITSYLGNYAQSDTVGKISNTYNLGNIESNNYGGGIVGNGDSTIIDNCYNIFAKENENIGNIVGNAHGMVIQNSYYKENTGNSIYQNNESTLINVMERTAEQLKEQNSYTNFDFENTWAIDSEYPYLKEFNYIHINDLIVDEEIELGLGESIKLEIEYNPQDATNKKIEYTLSNDNVVSIDDEFNITAIGGGEVTLTLYTLDGSNTTKEIKINVGVKKINLDDFEVIDDTYVKTGLKLNKINFANSITANETYKIKVTGTGTGSYVGTGNKIEIYNNDELEKTYTIFVLGDLTGTGTVNVSDVAKLYQHVKKIITMEDEFLLAADVVNDGSLRVNDVAKLYQYIKKTITSLEE